MDSDHKPSDAERTRSVAFVLGISAGFDTRVLIDGEPLTIRMHTEEEIARWQQMRSRVVRAVTHFEDGTHSDRSAHALAAGLPAPWWPSQQDSSDPSILAGVWGLESSTAGRLSSSDFAGGRMSDWTRLANVSVLMLRLAGRGYLRVVREMLFIDDENESRLGTSTSGPVAPAAIHDWHHWNATPGRISAVKTLCDSFWRPLHACWEVMPDDCRVAIQHFQMAQMQDWDSWELDLWICLEAMFGERTGELVQRISQFCALFSVPPHEGYDLAKMLRQRYGMRSEIVHGSRKPSKRSGDTPFAATYADKAEFEDVVRAALRRYLRLRLVEHVSREQIHDCLRRAAFDRSSLEDLAGDPLD